MFSVLLTFLKRYTKNMRFSIVAQLAGSIRYSWCSSCKVAGSKCSSKHQVTEFGERALD